MPYKIIEVKCKFCHKIFNGTKKRIYCSFQCFDNDRKTGFIQQCKHCSKEFMKYPYMEKSGQGIYCSISCSKKGKKFHLGFKHSDETKELISKHRKGKLLGCNNPAWNGGKYLRGGNKGKNIQYYSIYCPEHPYATDNHVFEHRLVMEKYIHRYLDPSEVVHHINGNRHDNSINNLMLFKNQAEHNRHHANIRKQIT